MPEHVPSRVLIVDDSESIRKRITQLLVLRGWSVAAARDGDEALSILGRERFDIVALDMVMPGKSGLALLKEIRQNDSTTCLVMLSGEGDAERATECAEAGADDFVEKAAFEPLQGLDFRLRRAFDTRLLEIERRRIAEELRLANEDLQRANLELQRLSQIDQLTRLFNRHMIERRLREEVQRAARYQRWIGVGLLDLDHFKAVNDTYGHQVGDEVLSDFGALLDNVTRATDICGRYGGEEFVIVVPETDLSGVESCLERVRRAAEDHPVGPAHLEGTVTVSCGGTAALPQRDGDSEILMRDLVRQADKALYDAKDAGRNRVIVRPFA